MAFAADRSAADGVDAADAAGGGDTASAAGGGDAPQPLRLAQWMMQRWHPRLVRLRRIYFNFTLLDFTRALESLEREQGNL